MPFRPTIRFRGKAALCFRKDGEGLDALAAELNGRITCFAGQSAVGKSSIINALAPGISLKTGELSKKTDRGSTPPATRSFLRCPAAMWWIRRGFPFWSFRRLRPPTFAAITRRCGASWGNAASGLPAQGEPGCAVGTRFRRDRRQRPV